VFKIGYLFKSLQSGIFARNRTNSGHEEEDDEHLHDQHVTDEHDDVHSHGDVRLYPGTEERSPRGVGGGSGVTAGLLGRIQAAVADYPARLREMNTWEPQSS
jgi:hypothetical protein